MFVNDIFEKGPQKSNREPRQSETEFGYRKLDPLIHKARQKYPLAANDTEALALFIADKEEADVKDLETKVGSVNQNAQTLIRRQQQVLQKQNKELDAIDQELDATKTDNLRQEKDIEQLVKSVNDANARYAAQEERFRDLTARVAAQKLTQTDVDAANIAKELERADDAKAKTFGAPQIVRNDVNEGNREWDEGDTEPPNNFAVYINGKKWKVFKGKGQFANDYKERNHYRQLQNWAQAKSTATGKEWKVYVTGEQATQESVAEATQSDIEKHIMEMRHAGYDITEGYGSYYCSTKKRMVQRKGPKQSRSSK
jgi:hypothetical protein